MGVNAFFGFGSGQDYKDSTEVIGQADQGGLGQPKRYSYLKADAKSVEIRDAYVAHVTKRFLPLGDSPGAAKKSELRVNGVVSNMPQFSKAFGCMAGQPMVWAKACRVW